MFQIDPSGARMLLADWIRVLGTQAGFDFSNPGAAPGRFTIGGADGTIVTADYIDEPPFLRFACSEPARQVEIDAVVANAINRVSDGDLGGEVWYSSALEEMTLGTPPNSMSMLMERLSSQAQVVGARRLAPGIIVDFTEASQPVPSPFAPRVTVTIHIAAPGPCAGHFSSFLAHSLLEASTAICAFAVGRPLALPPSILPSKADSATRLGSMRNDYRIPTLARKHVSLDIFTQGPLPGGDELFWRERAALVTYAEAMAQRHEVIASVLFVVAAECLTTPSLSWRHVKLTKRFIDFFDTLMPNSLDSIVNHANYEDAFGVRRGKRSSRVLRREFLELVYDQRSGAVHGGLGPAYRGLGNIIDGPLLARRSLFARFAECAILAYLSSPRSSLIGHPSYEVPHAD